MFAKSGNGRLFCLPALVAGLVLFSGAPGTMGRVASLPGGGPWRLKYDHLTFLSEPGCVHRWAPSRPILLIMLLAQGTFCCFCHVHQRESPARVDMRLSGPKART